MLLHNALRHKRIHSPYTGVNAPYVYCLRERLPATSVNTLETNPHCCRFLSCLLGVPVMPCDARSSKGKLLQDAEFAVFGSPCTPFARGGDGGGFSNPDSSLFMKGIDDCRELDRRKKLLGACMENSTAILEAGRLGDKPPLVHLQAYWKQQMPDWFPLTCIVFAGIYNGHTMARARCYLVSVPIKFAAVLNLHPLPLQAASNYFLPFPIRVHKNTTPAVLNDALDEDLTKLTARNVKGAKSKKYFKMWAKRAATHFARRPLVTTLAVDGGRNPDGNYDSIFMEDVAPSATTQNRKVLIFGRPKKDTVQKAPLGGRYWSLRERARTMGFATPLHVHIDGFSNHRGDHVAWPAADSV